MKRHSLHPSLAPLYAAGMVAPDGDAALSAARVPYPTPQQHAQTEAAFRRAVEEHEQRKREGGGAGAGSMPVRQPPTMLAAMQREDLTPEARRKVLARLAPEAALERKYKVIFDSSARRGAGEGGLASSFEIDVTPELLGARVHGFEVIGYSVPQAEWAVEPGEGDLPIRCGWGVAEGAREVAMRVQWQREPEAGLQTQWQREAGVAGVAGTAGSLQMRGTRISTTSSEAEVLLRALHPLYRNPVVGIEVLGAGEVLNAGEVLGAGEVPGGWVRLSLASPVGTAVETFLEPSRFAPHLPPPLSLEGVGAPESLGALLSGEGSASFYPSRVRAVSDTILDVWVEGPVLAQLQMGPTASGSASAPLGHLACRPAATLEEALARITVQLRAELQRARAADPSLPVTGVWVRPGTEVEVWFDGESAAGGGGEPRVVSVHGDGWAAQLGLSGLYGEARRSILVLAGGAPLLPLAPSPPRIPPIPDTVPQESYAQSLNALPHTMFLGPQPSAPDPETFAVPVRFGGGVHMVSVPSGEYASAPQLAAEITRRAAAIPALRPLRLSVRSGEEGSAVDGSSASPSASPSASASSSALVFSGALAFGLSWHLAEGDAQLVDPSRLGFRRIPYEGASIYRGLDAFPVSFPSVPIAGAASAALPTVPVIYSTAASAPRRLLLAHLPKPPSRVLAAAPLASPASPPLSLSLRRAFRTHPGQPLRLAISVPAEALRLQDVGGGTAESGEVSSSALAASPLSLAALLSVTSPSSSASASPPPSPSPATFADIASLFAALHDPLSPSSSVLFDTAVRLLGARGRLYEGREPTGPMDSDGPYRALLVATTPAAALPTSLRALDGLLANLAAGRQLRASLGALSLLLRKLIAAPPLSGLPLHLQPPPLGALAGLNGGVAFDGLSLILNTAAAPASASASSTAAALASLVATAARMLPALTADSAAVIVPGVRYRTEAAAAEAAGGLDAERVHFAAGSSLFVDAGPSGAGGEAVVLRDAEGGIIASVPVASFVEDGTGRTFAAFAGAPFCLTYDPAALAFASISPADAVQGLEVNAALGTVCFTPRHNLPSPSLAVTFAALDVSGSVVTAVEVEDTPATTLAKMLLVASNYAVSFSGVAPASGTSASASFALPTEASFVPSLPGWAGAAPSALDLRFLAAELCSIALSTPPFVPTDPDTGDPLPPLLASASLHAVNDLPFSVDYASRQSASGSASRRLRPERLGLMPGMEAAAPMSAGNSIALGSLLPPNDAERGAPPYLLMSVTLRAASSLPDGGSLPPAASYQHISTQGEIFSLSAAAAGSSAAAAGSSASSSTSSSASAIVRATAYVQVGSDGAGGSVRLLDMQDDRTPVLLPNAVQIGAVGFAFHRPDGTPYDFHGKRVMVALRFFSQTDNPAFFAAAGREG